MTSCNCAASTKAQSGGFGNLIEEPFDAIVLNPARMQLLKRHDVIARTHKDCKWLKYCWGGCPMEGVGGDYFECSAMCEAIAMLYEYLSARKKEVRKKLLLCRDYVGDVLK